MRAQGGFEVDLAPEGASASKDGVTLGGMSMAKRFHGDLEATSEGRGLTALTAVEGSAGYVAIERVSGTLGGRAGSFVLQHYGLMTRGAPDLTVSVVPDSGTGELQGLAGEMTIRVVDGVHSYEFEYRLPEPPK